MAVYLAAAEGELHDENKTAVSYHVPLTVEVIDPDAAKDSLSTVKVRLHAGTTTAVEVICVPSPQFGQFAPSESDNQQGNPALWMGRFVGQVRMQLGGEDSPAQLPRVLGDTQSTVGRTRPVPLEGEEEDAPGPNNNLLITLGKTGSR